jgi:serine/threonine protein kinase
MTARKTMTNNNNNDDDDQHTPPRVTVIFDQDFEPPPLKASRTMDTANSSRCDSALDGGGGVASPCVVSDGTSSEYGDIETRYIVDPRVLGTGHHGSVRGGTDRSTGEVRAVKSIRKTDGRGGGGHHHHQRAAAGPPNSIVREIALLREVDHRSIVGLVDVFEDDRYVHIVTDLCSGGELFDRIIQKTQRASGRCGDGDGIDDGPCFSEGEAAKVVYQILDAVSYLHDRDIVHRDIKPENILFDTPDEDSTVKLIDFGLSRKHAEGESPMSSFVGTPYYIAPEVLNKKYDRSCDLWSIGIVTYTLLSGYPPFNGADNDRVLDAVRAGRYSFPNADWGRTSRESRDFVRSLLRKDPRKRMTAREAMVHPWMLRHIGCRRREGGGVVAPTTTTPTRTATTAVVGGWSAPSAENALRGSSMCRAPPSPPAQPTSSPSPSSPSPSPTTPRWKTMRVSSGRFRYTPPFALNRKTPNQDKSTPRHLMRSSFW